MALRYSIYKFYALGFGFIPKKNYTKKNWIGKIFEYIFFVLILSNIKIGGQINL